MAGRIDAFNIGTSEYHKNFWNAMRGQKVFEQRIEKGRQSSTNAYVLPRDNDIAYMEAVKKENIFRQICTCMNSYDGASTIWISDNEDIAEWFPEFGTVDIKDTLDKFNRLSVGSHGLGIITRLEADFISDMDFDIQSYLVKDFSKRFGRAEEKAFINGTGAGMATGILHDTDGAEVGVTAASVTFDDVIKLYFSIDKDYRKNGVWFMNDETAKQLRFLKDSDGNYIWDHSNNTILDKPVYISNYMPSSEDGAKPIAFGDFSYYWIVNRFPLTVRTLKEKFTLQNQVGYLAHEFLDAILIRKDAIKVLQIAE